jgi:biliverdin reductase
MSLIRVGLVGTGYAAKLRAEVINGDDRAQLVGVSGHRPEQIQEFGHVHQTQAFTSWRELVTSDRIDLIIIASVNGEHGAIAQAALNAGKHVVVEYPLALDLDEAAALLQLAKRQNRFLHVEHIELLGGMHQALIQSLPEVGTPFYARYSTVSPQNPAPRKWTYHTELFGFPLVGALSRLHRLTHAFGMVTSVSCQNRYWNLTDAVYTGCMCVAQLRFESGLMAEVIYGKGETLWTPERKMEVHGDRGALVFDGDDGQLIRSTGASEIPVGGRRGLFAKDTNYVLEHLLDNKPMYVTPEESLYTLEVATAAERSATTGATIAL